MQDVIKHLQQEKIKAILEARDCKPERIKCRKCKIQEVCQSLQIKQWLETEGEEK